MTYFDFGINLAFWLTLLSTLLCVIYGLIYWNKDAHDSATTSNIEQWAQVEDQIEKDL